MKGFHQLAQKFQHCHLKSGFESASPMVQTLLTQQLVYHFRISHSIEHRSNRQFCRPYVMQQLRNRHMTVCHCARKNYVLTMQTKETGYVCPLSRHCVQMKRDFSNANLHKTWYFDINTRISAVLHICFSINHLCSHKFGAVIILDCFVMNICDQSPNEFEIIFLLCRT